MKMVGPDVQGHGAVGVVTIELSQKSGTSCMAQPLCGGGGWATLSAGLAGHWQLSACGQWGGKPRNLVVAKVIPTKAAPSSYPTNMVAFA